MTLPKWDLTNFSFEYGTKEADNFMSDVENETKEFEKLRSVLSDDLSSEDFKIYFYDYLDLLKQINNFYVLAYLRSSLDLSDEKAQVALSKAEEFNTNINNRLRFFHQYIIKLPLNKIEEFVNVVGDDSYQLRYMYDSQKYVLSEKEENVLSIKDVNGSSAVINLYDQLRSSLSFEYDGKKHSIQSASVLLKSPDRKIRRDVSKLIKEQFKAHFLTISNLYSMRVKDFQAEQINLRGFGEAIDVRIKNEHISKESVLALFEAAKDSNDLFQDFFKLKAKLLDVEDFQRFDLNAPFTIGDEKKYSFDEALNLIKEILNDFDPEFSNCVDDLMNLGRVDARIIDSKRAGAYNYPISGDDPFVFMQYMDIFDDLKTFAHELGHAIHSVYSKDYSILSYGPPIGICETASTFNEELLLEKLLESSSNKEKIKLLVDAITSNYNTVQRQIYIAMFERDAFEMINSGKPLTELNQLWVSNEKEQFGDAVVSDDTSISWSYIPHIFHVPFYCYNYGIGNLLSLSFLDMYKKEGSDFVEKYKNFLKAGGSKSSEGIVKLTGLDINDKNTWISGYNLIRKRVELLKELMVEEGYPI